MTDSKTTDWVKEEAVIRPFAEAAENLDENHRDGGDIWESSAAMSIDAKHLRAARQFLENSNGQ